MKYFLLPLSLLLIFLSCSDASTKENSLINMMEEAEGRLKTEGYTSSVQTLFLEIARSENIEDLSSTQRIKVGHFLKDSTSDNDELAFKWILSGLKAPPIQDKYVLSYYEGIAREIENNRLLQDILTTASLSTFRERVLRDWQESRELTNDLIGQNNPPSQASNTNLKRALEEEFHIPALQIAAYILHQSNNMINTVILEKLLFYIQISHLLTKGFPLYQESIEAWTQGPVTPQVWKYYKQYTKGKNGFILYQPKPSEYQEVLDHPEAKKLLDTLMLILKTYDGEGLTKMTHTEIWTVARHNEVLTPEVLQEYYARNHPNFWDTLIQKIK